MNAPAPRRAGLYAHHRICPIPLITLALITLAACSSTGPAVVSRYPGAGAPPLNLVAPAGSATLADAENLLSAGDAAAAATRYEQAAAAAGPGLATEYRLRAAEAANIGKDPERADRILDQIPAGALDNRQQARYRLLRGQTALARNDPARALRLLPSGDPGGEADLAAAQLQVRALALTRVGDVVAATQARVTRERYLTDADAIARNRDELWAALGSANLDDAAQARAAAAGPLVHGWVALAALARRAAPLADYEAWRRQFPGHPGEARLAALYVQTQTTGSPFPMSPGGSFKMLSAGGGAPALLLPDRGPLQTLGEAVRSGFVDAAAESGQRQAQIYSTANDLRAAYQQALGDGAGLLVGPLLKEAVAALARGPAAPVPVLALNYLDDGQPTPPGFYQFGLAPEDEARAAAEDAYARGLRRAVALTPVSDRGNRVLVAFQKRLNELGGSVVGNDYYDGEPQTWADPIRRLLRYVPIDDKRKAAAARARVGPGIDPQRRNDIDFVFISSRAEQARLLGPLFRYYHADRLPIYATAAAYDGSGDSDRAGIRFCDAPWLFDDSGPFAALARAARRGRNFDSARLYAMGHDAFMLARRIADNALRPGDQLPGATGTLRVDAGGAIHRGLVCAEMTADAPKLLPAPGALP